VKHPFSLEKLFSFFESQSIILSVQQQDQFKEYLSLIKSWSGKQNLVSRNDVFHLVERHFLPSAYLSLCLPEKIEGKIIDIGTGAGFPGVILKILRPEISLSLLDSSHKKVLFLGEVCDQLDLGCPIICQRCEEFAHQASDRYDILVSRAVARLNLLWKWSGHLICEGGHLYAFKGGDYQQELDDLAEYNLRSMVFMPDEEWLKASDYLQNKYIVKLEK